MTFWIAFAIGIVIGGAFWLLVEANAHAGGAPPPTPLGYLAWSVLILCFGVILGWVVDGVAGAVQGLF